MRLPVDYKDGGLSLTVRGENAEYLATPESLRKLADIFSDRGLHASIEVRGDERGVEKLSFKALIPHSLQEIMLADLGVWYRTHSKEAR